MVVLSLSRLSPAASVPLERFLEDADLRDIVERNFEVCIQACIDLGLHVLADLPRSLPDTDRGVFSALAQGGLGSGNLAPRLERMAGFRNVLAHAYAEVVAEKVHETLGDLDDIRAFVAELTEGLEPRP